MNIFHAWYKKFFVFSALVAITSQYWVYNIFLYSNINFQFSEFVIPALSTTSIYIFIQKFLIYIFEKFAWKIFLKKYVIYGTWYHVLQSEDGYIRFGLTRITQTVESVYISAHNVNKEFDVKTLTLWNSNSVYLNENGRLLFSYKATRTTTFTNDNIYDKEGIMDVQIYCDKQNHPYKMIGKFQDVFPSNKRGSIVWVRDVEWKSKLDIDNYI